MNFKEAGEFNVLKAEVDSLRREMAELARRLDDLSGAERKRTEKETLTLKKASNG